MQDRQIHLTKENDEYISILWRIAGIDVNGIINAAIDAKRKQDAALIEDIKALAERVKKHLSEEEPKATFRPLPEKVEPAPLPDFDPAIETPEQPKIRKKPGRKPRNFVEDTVREVRQAEKMSKDEFVDYFGGKG